MKIVTIVGARPQFIKAAVVSRLISRLAQVQEKIVHTGQHYDEKMSDIFFTELDLPRPHYHLRTGSGSHATQTAGMLVEVERVLVQEKPDAVLVYGDTNSTLAGALTAAKLQIPVAHVEAGLRSFDRSMPEEINRILTDHLARWLFCPTETAVANLRKEGITKNVHQVGDVLYDALRHYAQEEQASSTLERCRLLGCYYALSTLHRAGNTDDPARFRKLWKMLNRLAEEIPIVLPLHPRSRKVLLEQCLAPAPGLHIAEPVGYREMLSLERSARLIITDSGGVQKEAYMQGVPCLTLRDNTEWVESVAAGWNRLVGDDMDRLLEGAHHFLRHGPPARRPFFYGDGHAGERILSLLQAA